MLAVLSQIKTTRKLVEDGVTKEVQGQQKPAPRIIRTAELTLENLCITQAATILQNTTESNYGRVCAQLSTIPTDIKLKILQYLISRRELGMLSSLAALQHTPFTVFMVPRNHNLTDAWAPRFAPLCANLEVLDVRGCRELSLAGVLDIVRVCGERLVHLDISGRLCHCPDLVKVLQCTPNLKFLGIRDTNGDFSTLTNLAELCPGLQQLEMSYSHGYTLPFLRTIIDRLPNLAWLDLSWCSGVYDDSVVAIARTLGTRLIALNMEMCCSGGIVTDTGILELAKNCPSLERLSVNDLRLVTDVSLIAVVQNCPNLVSLHISGCEVTNAGISAVANHCSNLEFLSMAGVSEVTDEAVLQLMNKCEKLQLVDIASCRGISNEARQKLGSKLFHTHPDTNAAYIPFRVGKHGRHGIVM